MVNLAAMILVTGGTGLVGSHLLYALIAQGEKNIRATYRTRKNIEAVADLFRWKNEQPDATPATFETISWVETDVTDIPALTEAFRDVEYVYHCAALISFNPKRFNRLQKINVEGTANMVNLSLEFGIKKFGYVSSVAALGEAKKAITEETHWEANKDNSVYSISKFASELEVWRGTEEGLDAVLVNPGVILGEGFYNSGSGTFFKQIKKGLRYNVPGASGFVDVQDVVRALMQLMQSSIKNERYILVGDNLKFKDFFQKIAETFGVQPPSKMLKKWQLELAWRLDWLAGLFGKKRKLFRNTARSAYSKSVYSSAKLKEELNFEYTPLSETLNRVARHFNR
ncbi:MAG: NAD-dependent epimerase [Leeuwenhoekiella sp.]|nr:NAD-dependent epimerase [Leeuwenhoekiella sp.]MBA80312.1 NAD-dependent epimerase [Leeuwenhoekiella sp.]